MVIVLGKQDKMKHPNRKAESANKWICKLIRMINKRRNGKTIKVEFSKL